MNIKGIIHHDPDPARRRRIPAVARGIGVVLAVVAGLAVAGCVDTSPQAFSYTLEITITSSTGTVPSVEVFDDSAGVALVPAAAMTTPWTYTLSGDIDHTAPQVISIRAAYAAMPTGDSFSVTVVYTEEGYTDPVSYTIIDETASNSTGAAENRQILQTITLPYVP